MSLRSWLFGERPSGPVTVNISGLDIARRSDARNKELLEANNRYQQEARDARRMLAIAKTEMQRMRAAICNIKSGEVVSDEHFEILMDSLEAPISSSSLDASNFEKTMRRVVVDEIHKQSRSGGLFRR